jgi:hypothetical protein
MLVTVLIADHSGCTVKGTKYSPARTLGSWVGIALEAWMSTCVYSVLVLSCVGGGRGGLATDLSHVQGLIPIVYTIKNFRMN